MEFGVTAIEAVGVGAGGGGGGGGGATFFLQAPSVMIAPRMTTSVNHFMRCCFTFYIPPADPKTFRSRSDEAILFPTPIGLGIASCESQLLNLGPIGQHHPDFFLARAARLKHDMPSIM